MSQWEVEYTDQFGAWYAKLSEDDQDAIQIAVAIVQQRGPNTGRPTVDTITGSKYANMKEIRAGSIRILFAFDPRRTAILLIGGDKKGQWKAWYRRMIPVADQLYADHLRELEQEESDDEELQDPSGGSP